MKFLFVCQPLSDNFARPYLTYLDSYEWINSDFKRVESLAQETDVDVIWIEWANDYARKLLHLGRLPKPVIVRIHDWEIRMDKILQIDWSNVDLIWFINPDAMRDFKEKIPGFPEERMFYLPNAIDLDCWPSGIAQGVKHLGILSLNVQPRKRLGRALELMRLLPDEYRLTIRTSPEPHWADPSLVQTLKNHVGEAYWKGRIKIDWRPQNVGRIHKDRHEVIDFWRDKSHAVCVSDHEGFSYGLAEGMACGAAGATMVWDWGSTKTFWPWASESIEDLATWIQNSQPTELFRLCVDRFDSKRLAPDLERKLTYLL
jgi:hypothetical protein